MEEKTTVARTLLSKKDAKKYAGLYVCVSDFNSQEVIAADRDPAKALRLAERKGHQNPVVFYVFRMGETCIFSIINTNKRRGKTTSRDNGKNRKMQQEIKRRAEKSIKIMVDDCRRRGYKNLTRALS